MEETKEPLQFMQQSENRGFLDLAEQERKYKARINSNASYIRAQNTIFSNISKVDRLVAYSLNMNC